MADKKYDLAVVYRIYPLVSKNPAVHSDDKFKLSELCLRSFKDSLGDLKARLWVLLDNCPPEYTELFRKYFDDEDMELISLGGAGNAITFKMQCDILLEQNYSDYVYFAEDDYFYLPGRFGEMIEFMSENKDADFVSPYDHLDYYTLDIHRYNPELRFTSKRHWRTASTTCMTFLTTKEALKQNRDIFLSYTRRNYDTSIWLSITRLKLYNPFIYIKSLFNDFMVFKALGKTWLFGWRRILFCRKQKLWTPIPTIATHMESRFLSPAVNWQEQFNTYPVEK